MNALYLLLSFAFFMALLIAPIVWFAVKRLRQDFDEASIETKIILCVMCHEPLKIKDRSYKWRGAHKWCETYY